VTYNIDVAVIPGRCTSKLQPVDVSINIPFKAQYNECFKEWLINGIAVFTRSGNRKTPSKEIV
jgi:hypothetical protein